MNFRFIFVVSAVTLVVVPLRCAGLLVHSEYTLMSPSGKLATSNYSSSLPQTIVLTLGVVLSNPNITESMIRYAISTQLSSNNVDFTSSTSPSPTLVPHYLLSHLNNRPNFRLQINPVNANGVGLSRLLKAVFCSRSAQGTNALFLLIDKSSAKTSQGAEITNVLTTFANYIGIPVMAWTSSASDVRLPTHLNASWPSAINPNSEDQPATAPTSLFGEIELETLLLAPSIRSQARAIHALLKQMYSERKIVVMASVRTAGYETFISEIRRVSELEDRRDSLFEFDSHQYHMSARIIHILRVDESVLNNLRRELILIRDHTHAKAFVLFANQADSDRLFEEAHHLGMTSSTYVWVCGKPSLGNYGDQSAIPFNYMPGLIAVTYNTSLNAQLLALRTAVQIWSEGVRKFLHLSKAAAIRDNQQPPPLLPSIACDYSKQLLWEPGRLLHRAIKHRLAKMLNSTSQGVPSSLKASPISEGLLGLSDIVYLDLQFSRVWKRIGGWTTTGGSVIDDEKWIHSLERQRHQANRTRVIKIATLEEPPYVVYEFPDERTGKCDKKAIPCRLSPLAYVRPYAGFKDDAHRHVHISTANDSEHDHHRNGSLMCCAGFSMDLLRRLSMQIGFDFELFEVRDRKWGAFDKKKGQWNGLVMALLDGTADMVVTSLKINTDRNAVIDFSVPFFETGITILVRLREGIVSSVAFLEPFSRDTWMIVFFGCVNAIALAIFVYELLYRHLVEKVHLKVDDDTRRYSLVESLYIVLLMLFNSNAQVKSPQCTSTRLVALIWSFVCLILVASFMANLAAFMITKDDFYDFTGVDDYRLKNPYTKNPAWRYATIPSGATETIIRTNFPDMHDYMRPFMRQNADAGVEAVKNGELDAFIYDASVLEYKVGRDRDCALRTVGKWYALTGYGVALPKNSKWLQVINKYIVDYQRSGYLEHLKEYWLASGCKERQKSDLRRSHSLGILNLRAVFLILASCIPGCIIMLFVEHAIMRYQCRRQLRAMDKCNLLAAISPKMGAALSFKTTVEMALHESRGSSRKRTATNNSASAVSPRNGNSSHHLSNSNKLNSVVSFGAVKRLPAASLLSHSTTIAAVPSTHRPPQPLSHPAPSLPSLPPASSSLVDNDNDSFHEPLAIISSDEVELNLR